MSPSRVSGTRIHRVGRLLFGVAVIGSTLARCSPVADPFSYLPTNIGSEPLTYDVKEGASSHDWALSVAQALGEPATAVESATGFTHPGPHEYQSFVIRIKGVDGRRIIDPMIDALGILEPRKWVEQIDRKSVVRFVPGRDASDDQAMYAYAYGDVAVVINARRRDEAAQTLRSLP